MTAITPKGQSSSTTAISNSSPGVPLVTFNTPDAQPVPDAVSNPVKLENRDYSLGVTLPSDKLATTPGFVPNSQSLLDSNQSIQANPVGTRSQETPIDLTVSSIHSSESMVHIKRHFPILLSRLQETSLSDTDDYKHVKHCCMMRTRSGRMFGYEDLQDDYFDVRFPEEAYPINVGQQKLPIHPYDGTGSVIDFLDRFDILANAKGWDDAEKFKWLPLYLTGSAALHYRQTAATDYAAAKTALTKRYNDSEAKSLILTELNRIRQRKNERSEDYAARLERLANNAYSDLNKAQKLVLVKTHYLEGLNSMIKRHVDAK
jgi:hypothetical protein